MTDLTCLAAGERVRVLGGRNFEKHLPQFELERKPGCSRERLEISSRFHGGMEGTIVDVSDHHAACASQAN